MSFSRKATALLAVVCAIGSLAQARRPFRGETVIELADCSEATIDALVPVGGEIYQCPAGPWTWVSVSFTKDVELRGSSIIRTVTCAIGNPSTCTTTAAHGFTTGDTVSLVPNNGSAILGPSACGVDGLSAPCAWGEQTVTVTGATTFTIPVNVTTPSVDGQVMRHDTIITKAADGGVLFLAAGAGGSRVTGFKFIRGNVSAAAITDWRFDHNTFNGSTATDAWAPGVAINAQGTTTYPRGLIDHNNFINARVLAQVYINVKPPAEGYAGWFVSVAPGSSEMTFIEDNVFRNSKLANNVNSLDTSFSTRMVYRYNIASGVEACHFHGVQGDLRGSRLWECYNNLIISEDVWDLVPSWARAGTGVFWGNLIKGAWGAIGIALDNQRSSETRDVSLRCNGLSTDWDGNTEGNGYPCRDQIGRGIDASLGSTTPYPAQALDPAYEWDNVTETAANVNFYIANPLTTTIASASSATAFTLTACAGTEAGQALVVAVGGGAEQSTQIATVNTGTCATTVSPALSGTPTIGDVVLGRSSMHIRENRDYYNDTPRPGYTPARYPHLLNRS